MKTLEIICTNVQHALNTIETYPLDLEKWSLVMPEVDSRSNYKPSVCSIFLCLDHKVEGETITLVIRLPLFQQVIAALLEKYKETAKERLFNFAITTKDKRLVKYLWQCADESTRTSIMTHVLGQNE